MYSTMFNVHGWDPVFLNYLPFLGFGVGILIGLITWSLVWKGWALWLAARRGEKIWFGVLLLVNTLGVLEIIYIFLIAKQKDTHSHHKSE